MRQIESHCAPACRSASPARAAARRGRLAAFETFEPRTLPSASLQGLGQLPGGTQGSYVTGISADGSAVIGSSDTSGAGSAYRWTRPAGMQDLGPWYPGSVSADGSIVVGNDKGIVRWTAQSGRVRLTDAMYATPVRASADASVFTTSYFNLLEGANTAVRWTEADGYTTLGSFGPGKWSYSAGLSADGSVIVGQTQIDNSSQEAFRWSTGTRMRWLGFLPGGRPISSAAAASADGSVIVGNSGSANTVTVEAFRWTSGGGMVGLGDLPGGAFESMAYGVNADGSVVVGTSRVESGPTAFVWDAAHGMRDLKALLALQGVDVSGWAELTPVGVSADGTVIAGDGQRLDGSHEGWVATLDEQSPIATVLARHVFYNRSGFDGNNPAANAADDNAIATDKNALLAGQDRLPGFDNVTSYDKGINGVMIDVENLPVIDALLDASDFDFGPAGSPISVEVRPGAGVNGSDRVTLIWRDYNPLDASPLPRAVGNGWLTVTMKANYHTGLAQPDVFSFGNLIGETGDAGATPGWRVNALDLTTVKRALNTSAPLTSVTDFNRDGRTNALDLSIVKRNLNHSLGFLAATPMATADDLYRSCKIENLLPA